MNLKVTIAIPCLNEEKTIRQVVLDFRKTFPNSKIIVFDNCSTDQTSKVAREAGAEVVYSPKPGKGNVVQHIFRLVDSEICIMVDGDSTYFASDANTLLEKLLQTHADMVTGIRLGSTVAGSFRKFHGFGNRLITQTTSMLFRHQLSDMLTGLRVMHRNFYKNIAILSPGFEVETEMTIQCLTKGFTLLEFPIQYANRPEGSHSKLSTFRDGWRILKLIVRIMKDYKPLAFFSSLAIVFLILSVLAGIPAILDYLRFHYVYRVPLAILATGLGILSTLFLAIGVILDSVYKYHLESYHLRRNRIS